ncbi:MAG: TIGR00725 family protein [Marinilabiliales bacterium]|nr:MAG: TIGR00725 family protein [Marinilabiliales bacterium]
MENIEYIGVVGTGEELCERDLYAFGVDVGKCLASYGKFVVCVGKGGFKEADCIGVKESEDTFKGQTIGVIPESERGEENDYVDIVIPSGIGIARNTIIINTADIIIAARGGAGTLSNWLLPGKNRKKCFV